jgi:class III poly(R)-hydroxyalkanoic acid synthase PhaE subunit
MTETKFDWASMDGSADEWMKSANTFLSSVQRMWLEPFASPVTKETEKQTAAETTRASMIAALRNIKSMGTAMSDIESMEPFLKMAGTMPEMGMKLAQVCFGSVNQFHQKWLDAASRVGETAEAYKFDGIDESIFKVWSEIYEKEFSQFFNVPQLGLTRSYQEKMNRCVDLHNRYQTAVAEFLRFLSLPLARSFAAMQEKIGELAENGELPDDPKALYHMWIKVLEGHYMTLYQSQEYHQMLGETLKALSSFSKAKREVMEDVLSVLPVPCQSEIDDMAREIYELKKTVRELKKMSK